MKGSFVKLIPRKIIFDGKSLIKIDKKAFDNCLIYDEVCVPKGSFAEEYIREYQEKKKGNFEITYTLLE